MHKHERTIARKAIVPALFSSNVLNAQLTSASKSCCIYSVTFKLVSKLRFYTFMDEVNIAHLRQSCKLAFLTLFHLPFVFFVRLLHFQLR